jgi:hypothetical protein
MNAVRTVVYSAALLSSMVGIAHAQDTPADPAAYKQKLHQCVTQMKTDHPDMNHEARRKACRKQLGPAPKSPTAAAPASTPPAPTKP